MPRARRVESSGGLPAPPGTLFPKDREVASLDGTPIRYTVRGRGAPTVVLCAGFACPDNHWRYLVPSLERHVRVVVWNYRGMGASGLPRPPGFRAMRLRREDFRLDRYAEDLEAVLDAEGVRRAVLLGHSMGTQVALEGYRRMPGRVAGLALVAGPYASPFHTMYGSDLGDRLFPLVRYGIHPVPPALLRLWGPLWRSPLPYPMAALLGSMGSRARPADMDGYFQHMGRLDPLVLVKVGHAPPFRGRRAPPCPKAGAGRGRRARPVDAAAAGTGDGRRPARRRAARAGGRQPLAAHRGAGGVGRPGPALAGRAVPAPPPRHRAYGTPPEY